MKKPTRKDRLEHALLRVLEGGIGGLSDEVAARVGGFLGAAIRSLGVRRRIVEDNLRLAFPDRDERWRAGVVRAAYRHLGREAVAMLRLSHHTREEIVRLTEIPPTDWESFEAARAEGRGVLLVTGHYGNWEAAAAAVAARGIPVYAVVKAMRNPLVDEQLKAARERLGISTIDMRDAPRRIPRVLAEGGVIGIVADQDARAAGVWVPFFGVPASTYRGPALFALRFQAPIVASVARSLPDGRYRIQGQRLETPRSGDLERDVTDLTRSLAAHLESEIRKDPGQYFWVHKRWKTRPPAEPEEAQNGTTGSSPE
jgi:KDO2-lipid IV(A) lauroyltransferase